MYDMTCLKADSLLSNNYSTRLACHTENPPRHCKFFESNTRTRIGPWRSQAPKYFIGHGMKETNI